MVKDFCKILFIVAIAGHFAAFGQGSSRSKENATRAFEYLNGIIDDHKLWVSEGDTLRLSIQRLANHFSEPFDSVRVRLEKLDLSTVKVGSKSIIRSDTIPVRWLDKTNFIVDTFNLEKNPIVTRKTLVTRVLDTGTALTPEKLLQDKDLLERTFKVVDTIVESVIDRRYLDSRKITLHTHENGKVFPPLLPVGSNKTYRLTPDLKKIVVSAYSEAFYPLDQSPFRLFRNVGQPREISDAIEVLLKHTQERDSILVHISDTRGGRLPVWLTNGSDRFQRYWVKNSKSDSISVWIGNPSLRDVVMILEDEVFIVRVAVRHDENFQLLSSPPQRSLARVAPLRDPPKLWTSGFVGSLTLNQNYLSNWARGGTSSVSGLADLLLRARYNNTENKTNWENSAQLRFGTIRTKENDRVLLRTSTDILEVNSKFNKQLSGKVDFSTLMYFRTQVAKNFKQPNNEQLVSKFLNPGTFTVGMGFEYKPLKGSSINFSLLSYRNTFVLDTLTINQTAFGIDKDRRSRQEMGGQLLVRNAVDVTQDLKVNNSLRFFSNYLVNPLKVDVNWELGITQRISWFFSVRFNFHMIYDEKVLFPVFDNGQPVLLPDGTQKREPKAQINQLVGITLSLSL